MKSKVQPYLSIVFRIVVLLSLVLLLAFLFFILTTDYNSFIAFVVDHFHFENKASDLKNEYLTFQRYSFVRYILTIFFIFYCVVTYLIIKRPDILISKIINFWRSIASIFCSLFNGIGNLSIGKKVVIVALTLMIVFALIYGMFYFPISNDEIFSYLYFVDKGFLVTSVFYPGPNNHIFYSQLCSIADLIFDNPVLIMRVPAIIVSVCTLFIIFSYLLKRFSFLFAMFVTSIYFSFYNIYYYSFHGRGYVLIYLFFILSLFSLVELLNSEKKNNYNSIYIISSVLGFYSIPIFLYPFISLHLIYFIFALKEKDKSLLKLFFVSSLGVSLLVFLLYLPIIVVSGLKSIIGNAWVLPMTFQKFWSGYGNYIKNNFNYLFDFKYGYLIALLLLLVGLLILKSDRKFWPYLFVSCLFVPFFILIVQKVYPFYRVWDYLIFIFALLAGAICSLIMKLKSKILRTILAFALIIIIFSLGFSHYKTNTSSGFPYYSGLNDFIAKIYQKEFYTVYAPDDTYNLFLIYNARLKEKKLRLVPNASSMPDLIVIYSKSEIKIDLIDKFYYKYFCNSEMCAYFKRN